MVKKLLRAVAAMSLLGAAGIVVLAPPAHAGTNASGYWCEQRSWWDPRWPKCYAQGDFYADGEHFRLQDTTADGHSAVMKIWVNGVAKPTFWNNFGNGNDTYIDYSIAEGTPVKFQLCYGEFSSKTILRCEDKTHSGKA